MPFNPDSFTGTQNAGPKPSVASYKTATFASMPTSGTGTAATAVTEGNVAGVFFRFYDPANTITATTSPIELKDTATVRLNWDGTSADDIDGAVYYGVEFAGGVMKYAPLGTNIVNGNYIVESTTDGVITFTDVSNFDPVLGTGVFGVSLLAKLKVDTLVETGEHFKVKFTQDSSTVFTNSNYAEGTVQIADKVNTVTPANNGGANSTGTDGQDVFTLTSNSRVYDGNTVGNDFVKITDFGAGDKLKIDIADTNSPNLSMVNFGVLDGIGINSEALLLNGMRALNGLDCNIGGLYMIGVGTDTYIIFDSTRDGKLDTNGAGVDDVFVKLVGIDPHSLQSTNFELV
ncbi:MAG: hypothetical protein IT506_04155 [Aquabacterium sp.]|nr:hypothetical protein [Aquabacterium sp.]